MQVGMGPDAADEADEPRDALDAPDAPPPALDAPDAPPPAPTPTATAPSASGSEDPFAALRRDLSDASATHTVAPSEAHAPLAPTKLGTVEHRAPLAPGASFGHYEVIRPLGKGGMGEVYLARDTRLGRKVALKRLLGVSAHATGRFLHEARATAKLTHENIVALYELAEHQGSPLLVLEFVPGKTLADWLKARADADPLGQRPRLPEARAAELMLPVARALRCAHDAGIVHRDLKPANIMLADSGTVKVLDFGVAKLLGQDDDEPPPHALAPSVEPYIDDAAAPLALALAATQAPLHALTKAGTIVGTRAYMAPEQWRGEPVDGRTDLWALGVILFQLVTGEHPLEPLLPDALATVRQLDLALPSARERVPHLGKLAAVIDRCLLKHKEDRIGSAQELCDALEAIGRPHHVHRQGGEDYELNPYAGLSAFQEHDADRFFGREALIAQLSLRCAELPLLALVGASGAGKSSLVRAGLIPALKRGGEAWEAFVIRPGPHPLTSLADLLLQHAWQRATQSIDIAASSAEDSLLFTHDRIVIIERLRREPGLLGVALRARARRRLERLVLFVDQFEEVFTLTAEDERTAFLACLAGAADDPSSPLRIVLSVRHDFLDRLAASDATLAELVSRGTVLVGPLDRHGLERALLAPAEARAYRVESPALVAEMIASFGGAAAALPLLQFTATKLWEGRDRTRHLLTDACYRSFGGVGGALASHADSVLASLGPDERLKARSVLLRLVTPERTRAIVPRRELDELTGAQGTTKGRVQDRLIDARLLTVEGSGDVESTVEIVHESLIASWPLLTRWLDEAQDDAQLRARLRAVALEWDGRGKPEGLLWRGEAADEARRFHARLAQQGGASGLSACEARYLDAVVALDARERRRRRLLVGAGFAVLSLVVVVVSALAVRANQAAARAMAERAEAQRSATSARNATRMAAARERLDDPTMVLSLLREVEPPKLPPGWDALARWALDAGVACVVLRHPGAVNYAAWSPDGTRVVTASNDTTVRVFHADGSGQPLLLRGHEDQVYSAAWSPDGTRIVTASSDKTARVFHADGSGQPILLLRGHTDVVRSTAWSPDGARIVTASSDKTARVWNADGSGKPLILRGHEDHVYSAAWSPDGTRIVTAAADKTARVWNADGSGLPLILRGHEDHVYSAAWSPDGTRIVTASWDKTARVWNADGSGQPILLRGHENGVGSAAWSPDGLRIVTVSLDKTARVWNADGSGQPILLRGHEDAIYSAAWSLDGTRIVTGSLDKTARVWNVSRLGQPLVLRGHEQSINSAAWSPDGRWIITAAADKTARVWNSDGSGQPIILRGHDSSVYRAEWSPDGRRIVTASWDKTARIWSVGADKHFIVLRHEDPVRWAAWSPDGTHIVTASNDKTAQIWNVDGSGKPVVLRGHEGYVYSAMWSPDGARIVTASWDKTARVWNADGSGKPVVLRGHEGYVYSAMWSPDGTRVVTASNDKTARAWSADGSGQPLILRGHEHWVLSAGFSPDGRHIVTASQDKTVRVWNADGSGEPLILRGATGGYNFAAWNSDGTRIVAPSDDGTVWVWSELSPLQGPSDPKLWAATNNCLPVEDRLRILGVPDEAARADEETCLRRVDAARAASR
jgi:WD40 repeat protein/serine/threonine protein kinase